MRIEETTSPVPSRKCDCGHEGVGCDDILLNAKGNGNRENTELQRKLRARAEITLNTFRLVARGFML